MITVGNPEKQQTPMESYITYEIRTETDRVEYSIQQGGVLSFLQGRARNFRTHKFQRSG